MELYEMKKLAFSDDVKILKYEIKDIEMMRKVPKKSKFNQKSYTIKKDVIEFVKKENSKKRNVLYDPNKYSECTYMASELDLAKQNAINNQKDLVSDDIL